METLGDNLVAKSGNKMLYKYQCDECDYVCCKKYNWEKHLATAKHIKVTNGDVLVANDDNLVAKSGKKLHVQTTESKYLCEYCKKNYSSRNGLWKHKKICNMSHCKEIIENEQEKTNVSDISNLTSLICDLVKTNSDIHKSVMELCKNGINNNNNNNNNNITNSNNKTFNLQVFLNETCKDAMNISDFVESVKLQVSDLENVGKVGYIEGISNIIIKNLKALEVEKRPVHCADKKREVMYVKDENIWEKEDENNQKIRKAIRMIAHKNICMFKEYREKYPDCEEYDSKKNSQYNKIIYESMGGKGDNDYEKDTKIIKKIAKVVGIDKD